MRVTNGWINNAFVNQLNRVNSALSNLQIKTSAGLNYLAASESPSANSRIMQYKTELAENEQYIKNSDDANEWLTNTDSSLTSLESVIQRIREIALQGAQDINVETDFDAMAQEVEQLIHHITELSNTNITGNYIFSGENVTTKAITEFKGSEGSYNTNIITKYGEVREKINLSNVLNVAYNGTNLRMTSEIAVKTVIEKSITAKELLYGKGAEAEAPGFSYALPPLEESMNLSALNNGKGVQDGIIKITDRNGVERRVNLSRAKRLDDVLHLINQTGSFKAGIEDVPSNTAQALGLYKNAGKSNTIIGLSDPAMNSEGALLSSLNNGMGVPNGVLSITTRDAKNYRLDVSTCVNVSDVISAINSLGGGAVLNARYNMVDKNIEITDTTGGTGDFYIASTKTQLYITDLEPHTAKDLGLVKNAGSANDIYSSYDPAIESEASPLELLNNGRGFESGYIQIKTHSGSAYTINLTKAKTPKDIVELVNAFDPGNLSAEFDPDSNRIKFTDHTTGTNDFEINELNGSAPIKISENQTVAKNLGLLKTTKGNSIIGDALSCTSGAGPISEATLLKNLLPPPDTGILVIRGADQKPYEVDLTRAETIKDVTEAINASTCFKASFDAASKRFLITDENAVEGITGLTIEEKTNTARDLGFISGASNPASNTVVGAPISTTALPTLKGSLDLNPAVTRETPLSALNSQRSSNTGVNLGYVRITDKAGRFKAVDLRLCKTVGDVLDKINDPSNGLYIEAKINNAQNGISLIDKNRGAAGKLEVLSINCTAGLDLGIEGQTIDHELVGADINPALTEQTLVSALNGGKGLELGELYIQSGAYSANVGLKGAETVKDIIDKLSNSDNNLNLQAWVAKDGKSLNLTNTNNEAYIKVRNSANSSANTCEALGLGSSQSLFTTLIDLRDNLFRKDTEAISNESLAFIDIDLERVLNLHTEVGAKVNRVNFTKERHQALGLNLTNMLSSVEDIDISSAIIDMTEQEMAYKASLSTGAKLMQMSLLDFLR